MTDLMSFTERLGYGLRTLNILFQGRGHPGYRVSIYNYVQTQGLDLELTRGCQFYGKCGGKQGSGKHA